MRHFRLGCPLLSNSLNKIKRGKNNCLLTQGATYNYPRSSPGLIKNQPTLGTVLLTSPPYFVVPSRHDDRPTSRAVD